VNSSGRQSLRPQSASRIDLGRILGLFVFVFPLLFPAVAMAAGPGILTYQGRLTDDSGNPVSTPVGGGSAVTFQIFNDPSFIGPVSNCAAEPKCEFEETHPALQIVNGVITAQIGERTAGGHSSFGFSGRD